MKLLLVEDDISVRDPLAEFLRKNSFVVTTAANLGEARRSLGPFDIALIDWELPDGQGIDLIREWRAKGLATQVILLTARTDITDKVVGFELGADDYMTKPFELKELLARIRARLRTTPKIETSVLKWGDIEMNLTRRTVSYRGKDVVLAKMEFELLKFFMENPDRALARDEILNRVWGFENFPTSRTVDSHVLILRQKFHSDFFETLRGIGYRFKAGA